MTDRRNFLGRVAAAAALGLTSWKPARLLAEAGDPTIDSSDHWLDGLKGKHRQLFDMPNPNNGVPQLHIRNYLNTWRDAYHVPEKEVNAVGTLYGPSTLLAFNDAMWIKYKFGGLIKANDANGTPLTRNMFAHPKAGDQFAFGFMDSSIEALQARGVVFILCNNALAFWSANLAKATGGKADEVRSELLAHTLPGVVLVPGMVVAINRAQERGLSYMYL
ncbi:MAG: twin-arginine translocation signal domain-containing protein [Gemmatimonadales bacterium]